MVLTLDRPLAGGITTGVEAVADHLLDFLGVAQPPTPMVLVGLCDLERPVRVLYRPLSGVRASLVLDPDWGWLITVDSRLGQHERRFATFHEGGHILLRRGLLHAPWGQEEAVASQVARALLMPRRWLVPAPQQERHLCLLARRLLVSRTRLTARLHQLGALHSHGRAQRYLGRLPRP